MELIVVFVFVLVLAFILIKYGGNEVEVSYEDEPEEEEPIEEVTDYYQEKDDVRADIDTAIAVYSMLSEMDTESTDVLRWNLKNKLKRAKKQCLLIICDSLDSLHDEEEEEKN
jgi:hypothetical protein